MHSVRRSRYQSFFSWKFGIILILEQHDFRMNFYIYRNILQCHGLFSIFVLIWQSLCLFYVIWFLILPCWLSSAYCVVAVESVGRQVPIAFLERVKEDFNKRYGGGKAATAVAHGLNKEFGYIYTYIYVLHIMPMYIFCFLSTHLTI